MTPSFPGSAWERKPQMWPSHDHPASQAPPEGKHY